jgi:uncharacterized protein (DUF983 family)
MSEGNGNTRRGRRGCAAIVIVLILVIVTGAVLGSYHSAGRGVFALLVLPLIAAVMLVERLGKKQILKGILPRTQVRRPMLWHRRRA